MRLRHRESRSEEEQTISTLISIPLLPRKTNNAAPKEPEANRDKAASSLTLGLLICAKSVAGSTHIKKRLSCGIKSKSEGVVGGWEEKKQRGEEGREGDGMREIDRQGTEERRQRKT